MRRLDNIDLRLLRVFVTLAEAEDVCADFTLRRLQAAMRNVSADPGPAYTESGR